MQHKNWISSRTIVRVRAGQLGVKPEREGERGEDWTVARASGAITTGQDSRTMNKWRIAQRAEWNLLFVPFPFSSSFRVHSQLKKIMAYGVSGPRTSDTIIPSSAQGIFAALGIKRNIKFIMRLIIATAFAYLGLWHISVAAAGHKCSSTFDGPLQCLHRVFVHILQCTRQPGRRGSTQG